MYYKLILKIDYLSTCGSAERDAGEAAWVSSQLNPILSPLYFPSILENKTIKLSILLFYLSGIMETYMWSMRYELENLSLIF